MTGDDLGIAHVPTPVENRRSDLLERGDYRVLDVITDLYGNEVVSDT